MIRRALAIALLALAAGCSSDGHNAEDERRLAALVADPAADLLPVGARVTDGPTRLLAESDNVQLSGCCYNSVVVRFDAGGALDGLIDQYVDPLTAAGWQDVTVLCKSASTNLSARRAFDGFTGAISVEYVETSPGEWDVVQVLSAWYHTEDYDPPLGNPPDTSCLGR
ncbi:MAG: hypothetical protein HKN44_01445 [Ilumatobacter sp.]|nr:hypothetical protein [Ilumatobacter sp.]